MNNRQSTSHPLPPTPLRRKQTQKKWGLWLPQLTAIREFPGCNARRRNPKLSLEVSLNWGDRVENSVRPTKVARILRAEYWRGESYTKMKKLYKDLQRILSAWVCRNYPMFRVKEPLESSRGNNPQSLPRPGVVHVHTSQSGVPGRVLRRVLPQ